MASKNELAEELVHMKDEIIALQIKVAALEMLTLSESQRAEYERILKEQTERVLNLRAHNEPKKKPN